MWRPSLLSVLGVAFMAYICHSLWTMYNIYHTTPCTLPSGCLMPSWSSSSKFHAAAFVSTSKSGDRVLIWASSDFNISVPTDINLNVTLPRKTMRNGTLYLHIYLMESNQNTPITSDYHFDFYKTSIRTVPLTKYVSPRVEAFNLLTSEANGRKEELNKNSVKNKRPITHWIHRQLIHIMQEPIPLSGVSQEMFPYFKIRKNNKYLPMLFIDHFGLLEKDFLPVNSSSPIMPLKLTYIPVPYGKMRLMVVVEQSLKTLENAGFSDKETDDVKAVFFDTNIYLLFLTFIVSGFHLFFDILAFKNDISFWRHRKSVAGLSFRSLVWRCVSQTIVFAYLYDQGTSMLVLVPALISIFIELWKVTKSLKLNIYFQNWKLKLEFGHASEEEKLSDEYDSQGMKYLAWFVGPCCVLYAVYSLIFVQHTSWFSWCVESVVSGVYAFGFIFMLPQLFVNYKLKSVAHLPWRVFMYKAFNTVVDDLFAFIITMPTAHRIACFRDDVVFVIYLYQRWLYPVDKSRITEYSDNSDEKSKTKED